MDFRTNAACGILAPATAAILVLAGMTSMRSVSAYQTQDRQTQHADSPTIKPARQEKKLKMTTIEGEFDVKITPAKTEDPKLGLMTLDKAYKGKLEAKGIGRMLTGMTDIPTSAVYVAMEQITGTLDDKRGSFIIYHRGIMEGGKKKLEIGIVPDSGTDDLKGIQGSMQIDIHDGKHFYKFQYGFRTSK